MIPTACRMLTRRLKAKDPLQTAPLAQIFELETGSTFIVHSPPSALPIDSGFPQASTSSFSSYTHPIAQSGPSLSIQPLSPFPHAASAPLSSRPPPTSAKTLSPAEIQEIQLSRPASSQTELAKRYGVSRGTIARVGYGKDVQGRVSRRTLQLERQAEVEAVRSTWGPKKWLTWEVRKAKREHF